MLSSTTLRRSATNVHYTAPAVEQVGASIGRLDPVPDHMRQGRLDNLPGMVRLQPFGILVMVRFPADAGMNRSKKQAHSNASMAPFTALSQTLVINAG